ncbi:hypothetical protein PRZ48_002348 [Zasmidium cellare]|uniref:Stc1 domain-containing protein n=1 Tax=Zasmidium cellare TaxID=395010 RepID=A0ABR0F3S6_ZASCE|nr:hypothetical protein PRZ48_002348 [Zasmidium cellare]
MAAGTVASQRYYEKHVAPLRNVNKPAKIKCNGKCGYVKPSASFSNKKLNDLAEYMKNKPRFDPEKTAYVGCLNCTSGQKVEMRCSECLQDKGKDKYNKTQWKKDDEEAMCDACCEKRRETEAADPDNDSGSGSNDDSEGSRGNDEEDEDEDEDDLTSQMGGASLDGPGRRGFSSHGGTSMKTSTKGSSLNDSWGSSTVGGSSLKSSTNGTSRAGSTINNYRATSNRNKQDDGGSKWAKVPAGKPRTNVFRKQTRDDDDIDDVRVSSDSSDSD